jgi:cutinase
MVSAQSGHFFVAASAEPGPFAVAICQRGVSARQIARLLGAALVTTWAPVLGAPIDIPSASAAPCPDVEVVFARATTEPLGVGGVGQAFVDSLRSQVDGRSVGVYPVNCPASYDFAPSANAGANDASAHVQSTAANCPNTRMVLGGYSQGAMVIDLITAVPIPIAGFTPGADAAGCGRSRCCGRCVRKPSDRYVGAPLSTISPQYGPKTIDLCAPGDPICSPGPLESPSHDEMFSATHLSYAQSGMPSQAAAFAASHL